MMAKVLLRTWSCLRRSPVLIRTNCYCSTKEPRHGTVTTSAPVPVEDSTSSRPRPMVDRMIRVDHAGEFAANRIYAGQMSVLGDSSVGSSIEAQEQTHFELFNDLVSRRRVRPTIFLPLWDIAGFILGASTAVLGKEAAMACTVAVEEAVVEHYNSQLRELIAEGGVDEELLTVISKCRDEELEHRDVGLEQNAQLAPGYEAMSEVIKAGCRTAIWMSERL